MEELEKAAPRQNELHGDEGLLADTNFRNIVIYYMDELLRIEAGDLATEHLKDRQRRALVKSGVLRRVYGRGGCRLRLSNEAKRVLREFEENPLRMS